MQVNFCYGKEESVKDYAITPGNLYVTTDTYRIFFDSAEGERLCLGEIPALTSEELSNILV